MENEEAARDSLRQSDKQIICLPTQAGEAREPWVLHSSQEQVWSRRQSRAPSERSRTGKTLISPWAINTEDEAVSVSLGIIERNCLQSSLMGCPFSDNGLSN